MPPTEPPRTPPTPSCPAANGVSAWGERSWARSGCARGVRAAVCPPPPGTVLTSHRLGLPPAVLVLPPEETVPTSSSEEQAPASSARRGLPAAHRDQPGAQHPGLRGLCFGGTGGLATARGAGYRPLPAAGAHRRRVLNRVGMEWGSWKGRWPWPAQRERQGFIPRVEGEGELGTDKTEQRADLAGSGRGRDVWLEPGTPAQETPWEGDERRVGPCTALGAPCGTRLGLEPGSLEHVREDPARGGEGRTPGRWVGRGSEGRWTLRWARGHRLGCPGRRECFPPKWGHKKIRCG